MIKNVPKNVTKWSQYVTQSDSSSVRVADPGVVWRAAHAAGHVDLLRLKVELGVANVGVPAKMRYYGNSGESIKIESNYPM